MLKNINIRNVPERLYYKALELKGKYQAKSWADLLERLIEIAESSENKKVRQVE